MKSRMKRMDFVQNGYSGKIFLVTMIEGEYYLWDFQGWLKGYYDAYIPFKDFGELDYKIIGNIKDNPELLPKECDGYNGEPHIECLGEIFKNPIYYLEYAKPHKYEHSVGYPENKQICICGKVQGDVIHQI